MRGTAVTVCEGRTYSRTAWHVEVPYKNILKMATSNLYYCKNSIDLRSCFLMCSLMESPTCKWPWYTVVKLASAKVDSRSFSRKHHRINTKQRHQKKFIGFYVHNTELLNIWHRSHMYCRALLPPTHPPPQATQTHKNKVAPGLLEHEWLAVEWKVHTCAANFLSFAQLAKRKV